MILIKCNDEFYTNIIFALFAQKKIPVTFEKSKKYFFELDIFFENSQLKVTSSNKSSYLKLPIPFELLFSDIKNHFDNKFVKVGNFNYEPINQSITHNKHSINLNYIHNIIITNLILSADKGVDKIFLYKLIWSQDKEIQINKLDTHITNLKNKIKKGINIDLKIVTNTGILKLIID